MLARYGTQGALDPTFGGDGLVTTEFTDSGASSGADVALGGDGTILAAGWLPSRWRPAPGIALLSPAT